MGRACSVCQRSERDDIDNALVSGRSLRDIAAQYPPLTISALSRHHARHLSAALAAMKTQEQADRRATLLDRIEGLIQRAEDMFATAAAEGKVSQALDVLKELRLQLALLGQATGELDTRPQTVVNLQTAPEWIELRGLIMATLMAWPEARAAVAGRLLELEAGPS